MNMNFQILAQTLCLNNHDNTAALAFPIGCIPFDVFLKQFYNSDVSTKVVPINFVFISDNNGY
jgi:hypothetical protein